MTRFLTITLLAILLSMAIAPAAAQPLPFCKPGETPQFGPGFSALHELLRDRMGQPIECEHGDPATGDVLQMTDQGLAFHRKATNTPNFTNGLDHWALTPAGLIYWKGTANEPPRLAEAEDLLYFGPMVSAVAEAGAVGMKLGEVDVSDPDSVAGLAELRTDLMNLQERLALLQPPAKLAYLHDLLGEWIASTIGIIDLGARVLETGDPNEQLELVADLGQLLSTYARTTQDFAAAMKAIGSSSASPQGTAAQEAKLGPVEPAVPQPQPTVAPTATPVPQPTAAPAPTAAPQPTPIAPRPTPAPTALAGPTWTRGPYRIPAEPAVWEAFELLEQKGYTWVLASLSKQPTRVQFTTSSSDDFWGQYRPRNNLVLLSQDLRGASKQGVAAILIHEVTHVQDVQSGRITSVEQCISSERKAFEAEATFWRSLWGSSGKPSPDSAYERFLNVLARVYPAYQTQFDSIVAQSYRGACTAILG